MAVAALAAPDLWIPAPSPPGIPLNGDEVQAALLDPLCFIARHCWIRGPGGRQMPFTPYGYQAETIAAMDDEERLVVLKARQLGISWTGDAYALWLCTANRGQTVLILSKGLRESGEEMERIRFMHRRLPPELRRRVGTDLPPGERGVNTTQRMDFPDMDSRIICLPSSAHAGTSFTATLVVVHELAKIENAISLWAALTPTYEDGGRIFVISTAKGYAGVFHDLWKEHGRRWRAGRVVGERGPRGSFTPVFISWRARPGRDQVWYDGIQLPDKDKRQEYPDTPTEAFQGSTDAVFSEEFDRSDPAMVLDATRERSNPFEVVAGYDPGVNNAFAYLIEVQGRAAFIYREIHLQQRAIKDMADALKAACAEEGLDPAEVVVYPDPYAQGRNDQTLKTCADILLEEGLLVDREDERYTPAERVSLIKLLLKQRRLWVSEDCPRLVDALEQAGWAMRRAPNGEQYRLDTYEKDGKHEHPLDAAGTALARVFPSFAPVAAETSAPVAVASAVASVSGSEFGA